MLELRPNCECCNIDLPPDSEDVVICSFECTFCYSCASTKLNFICPNCSGGLVFRPIRTLTVVYSLENYPASSKRIYQPDNCTSKIFNRE